MPVWLQLLSLALQSAPTIESEVEAAVNEHWGKDHVQQLAQGLEHLNNIVETVTNVVAQKQQAVMPKPAMPHPPGTPMPSTASVQEPTEEKQP